MDYEWQSTERVAALTLSFILAASAAGVQRFEQSVIVSEWQKQELWIWITNGNLLGEISWVPLIHLLRFVYPAGIDSI